MSSDAWLALLITLAAMATLAWGRFPTHVVLLVALAALVVLDVVPVGRALSGFANSGVATIAVLFVVVAGVRHAGVLDWLGPQLMGKTGSAQRGRLRVILPTAGASAFMNNTPVVALLIPVVSDWCQRHRISPSALLMPLSFAAILGGTCTLIGTSTNLVIDGMMADDGHPRFGLFTPALIGVPVTLAALVVMLISARWLLPQRQPALDSSNDPRQFTVELRVDADSAVSGKTIAEAGLRHLSEVYLVGIMGSEDDEQRLVRPSDLLHPGDRLIFAGSRDGVAEVASRKGLSLAVDNHLRKDGTHHRALVEVVVAHHSPLVGCSINQAAFRTHYHAAVVAVARHGHRIEGGIGDHVLAAGDILLLEALPVFHEHFAHAPDFAMVSRPDVASVRNHARAPIALAILAAMVVLAATGILPILSAAILAAGVMLLTACCSPSQARIAIEGRLLLAIAAAFGLGAALGHTGAAAVMAGHLVSLAAADPWWTLVAIYVVTVLITELVTNNAAAIIMWPIVTGVAARLEVSVLPFAMAVMIAASASFLTPLGYQTNLMVSGPGGYRYTDFLRFGAPVALTVAVVTLGLIPWFFPFV
ncbi:MAG: SLC13 family permease [Planctomycetota bacterium]|nr:MAG: SLC13 family permease [Planctomycetota bacterium]